MKVECPFCGCEVEENLEISVACYCNCEGIFWVEENESVKATESVALKLCSEVNIFSFSGKSIVFIKI